MNEQLALRLLRGIMDWDEDVATREYRWVRLISRLKYDGYGDYLAGVRFAESLSGWLSQFSMGDRQAAYEFVKTRLVYFSHAEIQRLVEQLFPRFVEPHLREVVASKLELPPYLVGSSRRAMGLFERGRRQTLFIGLSDGARLDSLRRANSGILANDQVVLATHIDDEKWVDLGEKLAGSAQFAGDTSRPKFETVYLIDDFAGSGTTFVRKKASGAWTGKVKKFWDALSTARGGLTKAGKVLPLSDTFSLHVHHYISSAQARDAIETRLAAISREREPRDWFHSIAVTQGLLLPKALPVQPTTDQRMWEISEKYYDHDLFEQLKEHLGESGQTHLKHGYANAALPVVLEHNCPNNAVSLLWAETTGKEGHRMRPLFPRRHRHS